MVKADIIKVANKYAGYLKPFVSKMEIAGSIRRNTEAPGDIDILLIPNRRWSVWLTNIPHDEVEWAGPKKIGLRFSGCHIDIMITTKESWGASLLHFTGSKWFNIKCRSIAKAKQMTLNEYGLFNVYSTGILGRRVAGKSEREVLSALGLKWIEPELRSDKVNLSQWRIEAKERIGE